MTAVVTGVLTPLAEAHSVGGILWESPALPLLQSVQMFLSRRRTASVDLGANRAASKRMLASIVGAQASAFAFLACGIAGAGRLTAPGLPRPMLQLAHVAIVAIATLSVARIDHAGQGDRAPHGCPHDRPWRGHGQPQRAALHVPLRAIDAEPLPAAGRIVARRERAGFPALTRTGRTWGLLTLAPH